MPRRRSIAIVGSPVAVILDNVAALDPHARGRRRAGKQDVDDVAFFEPRRVCRRCVHVWCAWRRRRRRWRRGSKTELLGVAVGPSRRRAVARERLVLERMIDRLTVGVRDLELDATAGYRPLASDAA